MTERFTFTMSDKEVFDMVVNLMKFPFPQICRHNVAFDLLSFLEEKGYETGGKGSDFDKLCSAVCRAEDEEALSIIDRII